MTEPCYACAGEKEIPILDKAGNIIGWKKCTRCKGSGIEPHPAR